MRFTAVLVLVVVAGLGITAGAHDLSRIPAPSSQGKGNAAPVMASVTVFGCIVRESEYRAAQEKGHGGLIGTGIGVGNEFILTGATSGNPVSTTGGVGDKGQDYELTGPAEGEAAQFVHKRVAASGYFKPAEKESSLGLRQLKVLSVRAATGQCD